MKPQKTAATGELPHLEKEAEAAVMRLMASPQGDRKHPRLLQEAEAAVAQLMAALRVGGDLRVSRAAQERAREALRNRLAEGLGYRFEGFLREAALDEIYFLDEVLNTRESVGGDIMTCFLDAVPGVVGE